MSKISAPGPIIHRIGNPDAITFGGGVLFQTSSGPFLEYTKGAENSSDEDLEVFRTHIERDILKQFKVEPEEILDMCEALDLVDPKKWLKNSRGPDFLKRAECIIDFGTYAGWDIIDEDPLIVDEVELHQRWYAEFYEEGPITTPGVQKPEIIVPEMIHVLHSIDPQAYWALFEGSFPLIPSEALQNRKHPWWNQHGKEVVIKLVEILKKQAPSNFVFEIREETYGFWRTL